MAKVYRSTVLDAPADRVWRDLRDFNGIADWHPSIVSSRIENGQPADKVGCVRSVQLKDGARVRLRAVNACIQFVATLDGNGFVLDGTKLTRIRDVRFDSPVRAALVATRTGVIAASESGA